MSEENKPAKVELPPEPVTVIGNPTEGKITREEMAAKGWSKHEMEAAEKRGMVTTTEDQDKAKATQDAAANAKTALDEKADADRKAKEIADANDKGRSSLPDFEFKTPEQEKAFMDAFGAGTPQRAMYFRMKNERQARQRAENERDQIKLELQVRKDAEDRARRGIEPEPEVDADGNLIDPEDKPLTVKQLRAMQKAESEAEQKRRQEFDDRSGKVSDALLSQEEYAKSIYPDFEDTVKLATDLVTNAAKINDPIKRAKVVKLIRDLQTTAANADKYGVDDYTASMIAYELGQLHESYGKTKSEPDGDPKKGDPKANGSLTPEQMKRIEENTQRRTSSASLPGSSNGRRVVAVEDVKIKDVLRMTPEERFKFKKDHPAKFAELMRG
jgi:hypothetical protein